VLAVVDDTLFKRTGKQGKPQGDVDVA